MLRICFPATRRFAKGAPVPTGFVASLAAPSGWEPAHSLSSTRNFRAFLYDKFDTRIIIYARKGHCLGSRSCLYLHGFQTRSGKTAVRRRARLARTRRVQSGAKATTRPATRVFGFNTLSGRFRKKTVASGYRRDRHGRRRKSLKQDGNQPRQSFKALAEPGIGLSFSAGTHHGGVMGTRRRDCAWRG